MSHLSRIARPPKESNPTPSFETRGMKRARESSRELEVFHLFKTLLPELQREIFLQIPPYDPTRYSLSWTCKEYYRRFFHALSFNPYQYADACARLGREDQLTYSVQARGPLDHRTVCYAVMNGYFFKGLFKLYYQETCTKYTPPDAMLSFSTISQVAAKAGHLVLANRLCQLFKIKKMPLIDQLLWLMVGGQEKQAQRVNSQLKPQQKLSDDHFYFQLFLRAIPIADLKTTSKALEQVCSRHPNFRVDVTQYHQCLHAGAKQGRIDFLKLTEEPVFHPQPPLSPSDLAHIFTLIFNQYSISATSNHFECLLYLKKTGLWISFTSNAIPGWATVESLNWMVENGITFNPLQALEHYLNKSMQYVQTEVVEWALARGMPITFDGLLSSAFSGHIQLFNFLWEKKAPDFSLPPDSLSITAKAICRILAKPAFILLPYDPVFLQRRVRIAPFQKTIQMLMEKGCKWGPPDPSYNQLAILLYRRNKEQAKDFVQKLKMPLDLEALALESGEMASFLKIKG